MVSGNEKTPALAEEQANAVQESQKTNAPEVASEGAQLGVDLEDTALAEISGKLVVVSADGGLNLRTGPGRDYPVAELLEDGTLLVAMSLPHGAEVPGWALVHTGQRTGWVDCCFVQALEKSEEA